MVSLLSEDTLSSRAPPKVIGPSTNRATRPVDDIPRSLVEQACCLEREPFDPKRHLEFQPPKRIYTMTEIGLEGHGISNTAVSDPFPLFSKEAIRQFRAEIFSDEVLKHCQYSSSFNKNMIRGMGASRAPFTYDAWRSPAVLQKVSQIAGIDLVPAFDFEIANINVSWGGQGENVAWDSDSDWTRDKESVAWHYDSFPFVCVVMLSDCTGMVGGETVLRTPTGQMKVRGPSQGTAVVMQGRYINHRALGALGGRERITMVTPFRPRSIFVQDETVLTSVRGISNIEEMYSDYAEYRLERLEECIRYKLKMERQRQQDKRLFEIQEMRAFLFEQKHWIESMLEEMIEIADD